VLTYIQQSDRKAPILKKQIDEEDESMEEEEEEEEQKEQIKATVVAPTP
jgi:CO dehydrogenase/acetyl-CoA synthase beta subunit